MHAHPLGVSLGPPGAALIRIGADQLLLLGIHADHRLARGQVRGDLPADVTELPVPVRVLLPLDRLGVALQAVAQLCGQQPGHAVMRHPMPLPAQLTSEIAGRAGGPPQPGHRIPARLGLHQRIQRPGQARVSLGQRPAPAAFPADAPLQRVIARLQLRRPRRHRLAGDPRRAGHQLDPAVPQPARLRAQHQPALPLIQVRQQCPELRRQHPLVDLHHLGHTTRMPAREVNRKVI